MQSLCRVPGVSHLHIRYGLRRTHARLFFGTWSIGPLTLSPHTHTFTLYDLRTHVHSKLDQNTLMIMLRNRKYSAGGIFLRATSSVIIKVAGLKPDPKPGHHRDDGFGNKAEAVEAAWDVLQTWNALQTAAAWRRHCCEQFMREESTLLLEVSLVLFGRGQLEVPGQVERPQQRAALEVLDAARELVVVQHEFLKRLAALERLERTHEVVLRKEEFLELRAGPERFEAARELVACKCANN